TILEPLESRLRLFCSMEFEAARLLDAIDAAELVLMTTDMVSSLMSCPVRRATDRRVVKSGHFSRSACWGCPLLRAAAAIALERFCISSGFFRGGPGHRFPHTKRSRIPA